MLRKKNSLLCLIYMAMPLFLPSCATTVVTTATTQPNWVRDPYAKYDRQANVAAVGFGSSREAAEKSALGSLVTFFGQDIQVDELGCVEIRLVLPGFCVSYSILNTASSASGS